MKIVKCFFFGLVEVKIGIVVDDIWWVVFKKVKIGISIKIIEVI